MKKIIIIITAIVLVLAIVWIIKPEKRALSSFENRTYVIGNYEYTSRTVLTNERIEQAMKTSKNKIIYYKNAYGIWVDAKSGTLIEELPGYFRISHSDSRRITWTLKK